MRPCGVGDAQNGYVVIHGAVRGELHAPILGKAGSGVAERQVCRMQVAERMADGGDDLILEILRILVDLAPLARVQIVGDSQHPADHRSAVRVRRVEHQAVARQAVLLVNPRRDLRRDFPGNPEEIRRHEYDALACAILERQRLDVNILELAFRRLLARRISGHPDRAGGGYDGGRNARLPAGGVQQ